MNEQKIKQLIQFQQGELDAVVLYQQLAKVMKDSESTSLFLQIAADEGGHAAIIRKITQAKLTPSHSKARLVVFLYRLVGLKRLLKILSNGERKASVTYQPFIKEYPTLQQIANEELKHADLLALLANKIA